jgi:hypothetical protein
LGDDFKARKLGDPKGGRYRDVRGVTTAAHDNAAYAGIVVARVYGIPTAIEKDFSPGAEIHGIGINRNADVAEIASAIPRGNIHAPADHDGEMREVAAYTDAFVHGIAGAAGGTRIGITEPYLCVHEIANRLHTYTPLYPKEADILLAARASHSVVLSLDDKRGPIRDAYQQGGMVVFLTDFEKSGQYSATSS